MHVLVSGKARVAASARTLLARAGGVWMWPGIALTERRGAACIPARRMWRGSGSAGCMAGGH